MMALRRRWWWIGGAIVLLLVLWLAMARGSAVPVHTGIVSSGPLRVTVDEAGTTRVRNHADVSAPVGGRWVPSPLRAGDSVRVGQQLGTLYALPLDPTAQQQARAQLGAAEAAQREADTHVIATRSALEEAERTLQRAERLAAAGGVSAQEVERANAAVVERRSALEAAQLRARAARYELESARAVVAQFSGGRNALRITAPVAGAVLRIIEEHERVVVPGTPLVAVGDPQELEVIVPLLTSDAARVREGAPVLMTFGAGSDTVHGVVRRVEPSAFTKLSALGVEEQRVNVVASVPAGVAHIGHQFRVQVKVTIWETDRALRVPASALMRDGERWFAYLVEDGRAHRREVTVGQRGGELVEVREGLAEGDTVVLFPGDVVSDGTRVRDTR